MKVNGREIAGPNRVTLVLPRENADDIVIIAQSISDMSAFDKYIELPLPPSAMVKGGNVEHNYNDSGYVEQLAGYNLKKMAWIVLTSLAPSNIEWEKVDLENPGSWVGYVEEMKDAGFSEIEVNRVCNLCMEANALDEGKLEAARQVFLRGQAE
jgi:hypothetical protein